MKTEKHDMLRSVRNFLFLFVKNEEDRQKTDIILDAMDKVDRGFFCANKEYAYLDSALSIGMGQTISQPSTVARMLLFSEVEKGNTVLELGSGSGWNACLTGYICHPGKVLSLDIIPELIEKSEQHKKEAMNVLDPEISTRLENIEFKCENIIEKMRVWMKTYDRIIITAGIRAKQKAIVEKLALKFLKDRGILIVPSISGPIFKFVKKENQIEEQKTSENYAFVPLLGEKSRT